MCASRNTAIMSRRSALACGVAAAAFMTLPVSALANVSERVIGQRSRRKQCEPTLGKYLCETVHEQMAVELDRVISDPAIDGEQTALALMEARCPGCGERVHPAKSTLSAVIPQWKSPVTRHGAV